MGWTSNRWQGLLCEVIILRVLFINTRALLSICGKSTVRTKIIKLLTDWNPKDLPKNESDCNKEVMEKNIELLALSNITYIYMYNFNCQNLYCLTKNASLVIWKQSINHLKLVCNTTGAWLYWNKLPIFIFCRVLELYMNEILKFWEWDLNKNKNGCNRNVFSSGLCCSVIALQWSISHYFLTGYEAEVPNLFLVDTALLCKITSKYLLLSSTLLEISGAS